MEQSVLVTSPRKQFNNLDTYDLYRRIEYIRDSTDKIIPDSDGGVERKTSILLMLDVLLEDTIPNTRTEPRTEPHRFHPLVRSRTLDCYEP